MAPEPSSPPPARIRAVAPTREIAAAEAAFERRAMAVAIAVVVVVGWILFADSRHGASRFTADLLLVLSSALAGTFALTPGLEEGRVSRLGWLFMGGGLVAWAAGRAFVSYEDLLLTTLPFPSWADAAYFAFPVFAVLSIMTFLGLAQRSLLALRSSLDGLLVGTALLLIFWVTFLSRLYNTGTAESVQRLVAIAYPLADVVLLTLAITMFLRVIGPGRRPVWLLLGGSTLVTISDIALAFHSVNQSFDVGLNVGVGWLAGFACIGLAASDPRRANIPSSVSLNPPTALGAAVPYLAMAIVLGSAAQQQLRQARIEPAVFWMAAAFLFLLAARQMFLVIDNVGLTRRAQHALAAMQEADEQRNQVLNAVSHDLANPLTPIRVSTHLLLELGGLDEAQLNLVEAISRSGALLQRMVEDLKALGRLQARRILVEPRVCDIDPIIRETMNDFHAEARHRGVALTVQSEKLMVLADDTRITQVLANLVGNALKFSRRDHTVTVSTAVAGPFATVSVRDQGRGVSPEEAKRLFEPFSQVHDRNEIAERGTGLGLFVCKSIVEAHGGRIWVDSSGKGAGATFSFTLPLAGKPVPPPTEVRLGHTTFTK